MDIYFDDNNNTDRFETNVRDEEEDYNEGKTLLLVESCECCVFLTRTRLDLHLKRKQ